MFSVNGSQSDLSSPADIMNKFPGRGRSRGNASIRCGKNDFLTGGRSDASLEISDCKRSPFVLYAQSNDSERTKIRGQLGSEEIQSLPILMSWPSVAKACFWDCVQRVNARLRKDWEGFKAQNCSQLAAVDHYVIGPIIRGLFHKILIINLLIW